MRRPELSIIVPAFNEEKRIGPTVRDTVTYFRARRRSIEILVVDDGSRDRTGAAVLALAAEFPEVQLIRLAANEGKGYAVRTGVVNSRGRRVLFQDADGATPIAEIERLDSAIDQGADLAIGSRAILDGGVQVRARFYRKVIGRSFHLLVNLLTVRGFRDTQCGFKLFRAEVAHDLFTRMRMKGFSFDVELLLMAQLGRYRVDEVPVNWVHQPGSRVNLVFDSARMARDLFVIRGLAMRGAYADHRLARLGEAEFGADHQGIIEEVAAV